MAGLPVKVGDSWRSDHEERKYKEWFKALSETGGDGSHKRSNSAPAEERGHHPHIHHILSQPLNNLKSQPLEISEEENTQAALLDCPVRCPHEQFRLSFKTPTKKDVDGCQPTMRETSSTGRKRKKHQHSSDLTSLIEPEDIPSPQSLEEIAALPSNIENEGVATSCKRIKLITPQIKKYNHHNVFEPPSHSRHGAVRSVDELGDDPNDLTLDSDLTIVNIDGETREQNTLSGNRKATKIKTSGRNFLARYNGPANNFPDYGPPAVQTAVALAPGKNKIMAGEKKASIPGSFRPVNTLQRNDSSPSVLPRPTQKKVFDLHENNSTRASDEPRAAKRQKVGTANLVRRESSGSIIDISADGAHVGTGRNISSTSSTPKKTVQSVSSRSHYQNLPPISRLGEVDEYKKTEAMIGFAPEKKRKAVLSELERRSSFRGEIESGPHQRRTSLMSEPPVSVSKGAPPTNVHGVGKNPILVEDLELEEMVELSQVPKAPQGRMRNATSRPAANKFPATTERSQYFGNTDKHGATKNGVPNTGVSSDSSGSTVGASEREEGGSPGSSQSLGNAVDEVQYPEEDSIDLVESADGPERVDQKAEGRGRAKYNVMKPFASPKSKSISEEGDIPQSAFSGVRSKNKQSQTSRMLKSELTFEITYMQSGHKDFNVNDDCVPWRLQYDHDKKEFDIIAYGDSVRDKYPSLVLKPEKIHIVKYHQHGLTVVISRAMEPSTGSAAQVLVKMRRPGDGDRLAQSLKKLNHTIKLSPLGSDQLNKIFDTATKSNPSPNQHQQDIALLTVKEARRATEHREARDGTMRSEKVTTEEWSQPANIGRRRSSTAEQDPPTQTRRQSVVNRMLLNSLTDDSVPTRVPKVVLPARNELSRSSRPSTLQKEDFYSSRPTTRASAGQWNGERQFQTLTARSPSPVRWTTENPSWKEEHSWEASLTFPKEGKKKATVDARDIERLDEGEFLNDNLIAFYLRYLEDVLEKSRPELPRRIYFHNTFFYETLTKGKIRSNNINYDAVKRWTSKVDLFSFDYIVVPVCEKLHWYVAIICNAPRLLQTDIPDIRKSQDTDEHATLPLKAAISPTFEDGNDDSEAPKMIGNGNEAAEPRSASPSVVAQVEHLSLEDQEWPEPDAMPDAPRPGIAQLRNPRTTEEHNGDPIREDEFENQGRNGDIRPKGKKLKRKSIPPARKYDPSDPRIITLDSLGQAHSPTCSNLKEYLVCEAKARHNVDIVPGRLGMTAKGLPQQSNYCDCGVFVLGYIAKFLDNPDEFAYNILQGDMTENKACVEIEASKIRGEIRELIFRLQAEQTEDETVRPGLKSKAKKVSDAEAQSRVSSKLLGSKSQLASEKSSKAAELETEPNGSNSMEPVIQPAARSVTGKVRDGMRAKTPDSRRSTSVAINGQESGSVDEIEPRSIDVLRAKRSRHFSKGANTPGIGVEDVEIMETPAPKTISRDKDHLDSPVNSTESSIQLDSPLHPDSLKGNWLKSPNRKAEAGSRTHNTFKEYSKSPDSPSQNTRRRDRHDKTSEHNPVEVNDSQEGRQLEVRETPPIQRQQDNSFEDILELATEPRKSKTFALGGDHSPDPEVVSPFRVLRRKAGTRR